MPIRRAGVTANVRPNNDAGSWVAAVVIIGVLVGLAAAVGDHQAATPPPPPVFQPPPIVFDPALLDGFDPITEIEVPPLLATVTLEHEIHRSEVVDGRLFATGRITAPGSQPLDEITVEVSGRERGGAALPIHRAVVSCEAMTPREVCAWMIDVEVPSTLAEVEFAASGRIALGLGLPRFELRGDRPGELKFDAKKKLVEFRIRERSVISAWATVTAYGPEQRVLGVSKTQFPDRQNPGRKRLPVAVPESDEEIERYEVRVGGLLPDW